MQGSLIAYIIIEKCELIQLQQINKTGNYVITTTKSNDNKTTTIKQRQQNNNNNNNKPTNRKRTFPGTKAEHVLARSNSNQSLNISLNCCNNSMLAC